MQISSLSRHTSSHARCARGFTLVELLISLAIIGMIYATVLVNFASFDSVTILKSTAFEVAGTIREAQVLSISVLGVSTGGTRDFSTTYGVHFAKDSDEYKIFRDTTPPGANENTPEYNESDAGVGTIFTYTMMRNTKVIGICVKRSGHDEECDITSLDISFKRPEFAALFHATESEPGGTSHSEFTLAENQAIESAKIKLQSTNPDNVWLVEIGVLGHISVKKQ